MKAVLEEGLALRDRYATQAISLHGLWTATGRLEVKLDRLLARPYRDPANRRLAKHLGHERPYLFTFLYCPGLDATNNAAERAIRALIGARKNWGGKPDTERRSMRKPCSPVCSKRPSSRARTPSTSWWNYCVAEKSKRFSTSYRQPRKRPAIPGTTHRLRFLFQKSSMPTLGQVSESRLEISQPGKQ